jgi:pyruvate ferredoxin oxidoreductase alpha subunit
MCRKRKWCAALSAPQFDAQVVPGSEANLHGMTPADVQSGLIRKRHETMLSALALFEAINKRFSEVFGRSYKAVDAQIPKGAKTVVLAAGSTAETVRWSLPQLNDVGLIQLRMFRPFPAEQLSAILETEKIEKVVVIDRNCSTGMGGIFAQELRAALYGMHNPPAVHDLILAGGVDLTLPMLKKMLESETDNKMVSQQWGVDF